VGNANANSQPYLKHDNPSAPKEKRGKKKSRKSKSRKLKVWIFRDLRVEGRGGRDGKSGGKRKRKIGMDGYGWGGDGMKITNFIYFYQKHDERESRIE
jgi:hypothetical protein